MRPERNSLWPNGYRADSGYVQARALSLVDDSSRVGHFPVAAHGYDRAAVDAFMERTAAERRRVEADLAQLEAAFRDLALGRVGERRDDAKTGLWTRPEWLSPAGGLMLVGAVAAGVALMVGLTNGHGSAPYRTIASTVETPVEAAAAEPMAADSAAAPAPAEATVGELTPALPISEGLVLTLTATSECWIRTTVDAGEPRERLLATGEQVTIRAGQSATLRVGDPAALVLEINGQPARPLGRAGRAVTAEITTANYTTFVSSN